MKVIVKLAGELLSWYEIQLSALVYLKQSSHEVVALRYCGIASIVQTKSGPHFFWNFSELLLYLQ